MIMYFKVPITHLPLNLQEETVYAQEPHLQEVQDFHLAQPVRFLPGLI